MEARGGLGGGETSPLPVGWVAAFQAGFTGLQGHSYRSPLSFREVEGCLGGHIKGTQQWDG